MITTTVEKDVCPSCGHTLDAFSSSYEEAVPEPGDLSMCINCLAYLVIGENLKLKILEVEEFINLPNETTLQLMSARAALSKYK
jgi:hypothetical protein